MKRILTHGISIALMAISVGAMGCASTMVDMARAMVPTAVITSQQESFSTSQVQQIEVLPVLDGRRVVQEKVDFAKTTKGLPKRINRSLGKKGYECLDADTSANLTSLTPGQIPFANVDQIRKIGSGRTRWVLVPAVENMAEVADVEYNELTLLLFDREAGKLAWEGSGSSPKDVSKCLSGVLKKFPVKKK